MSPVHILGHYQLSLKIQVSVGCVYWFCGKLQRNLYSSEDKTRFKRLNFLRDELLEETGFKRSKFRGNFLLKGRESR